MIDEDWRAWRARLRDVRHESDIKGSGHAPESGRVVPGAHSADAIMAARRRELADPLDACHTRFRRVFGDPAMDPARFVDRAAQALEDSVPACRPMRWGRPICLACGGALGDASSYVHDAEPCREWARSHCVDHDIPALARVQVETLMLTVLVRAHLATRLGPEADGVFVC